MTVPYSLQAVSLQSNPSGAMTSYSISASWPGLQLQKEKLLGGLLSSTPLAPTY